jgi:hypothetical protein
MNIHYSGVDRDSSVGIATGDRDSSVGIATVDRDSSVGIATRYRLDILGIESLWGTIFSTPVHISLGAHTASCTMGTGYHSGG